MSLIHRLPRSSWYLLSLVVSFSFSFFSSSAFLLFVFGISLIVSFSFFVSSSNKSPPKAPNGCSDSLSSSNKRDTKIQPFSQETTPKKFFFSGKQPCDFAHHFVSFSILQLLPYPPPLSSSLILLSLILLALILLNGWRPSPRAPAFFHQQLPRRVHDSECAAG